MNELIKLELPKLPDKWDYNESVKKVKQFIYKWKNMTKELVEELYVARKKLSKEGNPTGSNQYGIGEKSPVPTWNGYCEELNLKRNTVNIWLDHWFPKKIKGLTFDDIQSNKLSPYDQNMYYFKSLKKDYDFDENILCIDPIHGDNDIREYKDYYPTVTAIGNFFHPDGREFTLREYANVQDFPSNFKFAGSKSEIKKQIGEAVSPRMGEFVISTYIKGTTYIELFAGCGGFSVAAYKLGKKCLWCNDINRAAIYSFKLNFPETKTNHNNIRKVNEKEIYKQIGKVDFILGGPPCQGFSIMQENKLGFKGDPRNQLYLDYLRFVNCFKPKQFIMENVEGISKYVNEIKNDFKKIGYDVEVRWVDGLDIGMKQKRIRVFFIGDLR